MDQDSGGRSRTDQPGQGTPATSIPHAGDKDRRPDGSKPTGQAGTGQTGSGPDADPPDRHGR